MFEELLLRAVKAKLVYPWQLEMLDGKGQIFYQATLETPDSKLVEKISDKEGMPSPGTPITARFIDSDGREVWAQGLYTPRKM